MTKEVELYDPHPGFGGGAIALPKVMKDSVDELDGKRMTLEKVIEILTPVADELGGKINVIKGHYHHINFLYPQAEKKHCFRLIRYRE